MIKTYKILVDQLGKKGLTGDKELHLFSVNYSHFLKVGLFVFYQVEIKKATH